ncbi:unnamed protein product [Penicillium pancosmium]
MGMDGNYDHGLFGPVDIDALREGEDNPDRLRAVVHNLTIRFSDYVNRHGHKYLYAKVADETAHAENEKVTAVCAPEPEPNKELESSESFPIRLNRKKAVERVVRILNGCRGRETPEIFNPALISQLFWEQSERWDEIARDHIDTVAESCTHFVLRLMDHLAPPDIKDRLLGFAVLLPVLQNPRETALNELNSIIQDNKRHPMTYNHYFTDDWQSVQEERLHTLVKHSASEAMVKAYDIKNGGYKENKYISSEILHGKLNKDLERNMDKYSLNRPSMPSMHITREKQVIVRRLVAPLSEVFSPIVLARYNDQEIHFLASEQPDLIQMRETLESKAKMLQECQKAFRIALGLSL